jgi:hypothetical protein
MDLCAPRVAGAASTLTRALATHERPSTRHIASRYIGIGTTPGMVARSRLVRTGPACRWARAEDSRAPGILAAHHLSIVRGSKCTTAVATSHTSQPLIGCWAPSPTRSDDSIIARVRTDPEPKQTCIDLNGQSAIAAADTDRPERPSFFNCKDGCRGFSFSNA